jgi:hypothetical protein
VSVDASDPDGDAVELVYRWQLNGARMPSMALLDSGSSAILPKVANQGDLVEVMVIATDGELEGEALRLNARVGNRIPQVLQIQLSPFPTATRGDTLEARASGFDADEDRLSFNYGWLVNDTPVDFHGPSLPREHYQRGDEIRVVAVASDGSETSAESSSGAVRIVNSAPRITSLAPAFDPDGVFRYRPRVEDADGDRSLRYRLLEHPKGMSINLVSGAIRWKPKKNQAGLHTVRFEVDDRNGGQAEQSLEVQVAFETVAAPARPSF